MSVLFYGTSLFVLAFTIHFFLWKIRLPKYQIRVLLGIFLWTLIAGIFVLWAFSSTIRLFGIYPPRTIHEYLQLSIFFISLTMVYITTYSALEVDSPSLVMIMNIAEAGPDGLDKNSFEQDMDDNILVIPRVKDLVRDGMVYLDGDVYKLKPKGISLARIFTAYRNLVKADKGG